MLAACPAWTALLAAHAKPGPVGVKIHNPAAGCSGEEGPNEELRATKDMELLG